MSVPTSEDAVRDESGGSGLWTLVGLRATLEHLRGRRTIVVVAHRLATVLAADRIVVLAADRIVVLKDGTAQATGTHQQLLEHDATYQSYVKAQDLLRANEIEA